jgi:hypothetical protein
MMIEIMKRYLDMLISGGLGLVLAALVVVWWLLRCYCDVCGRGLERVHAYPRVSEPRPELSPPPRPPAPIVDPGFDERKAHLHADRPPDDPRRAELEAEHERMLELHEHDDGHEHHDQKGSG